MKAIRDYVEVMFQEFPKTKKVNEVKMNILDTMENKYNDLIADGKNEQEAVGIVIGQFGNIDELKAEFGLEVDENVEYLESSKVSEYIRFKKKLGRMIGLGISLIILGVGLVSYFNDSSYDGIMVYIMIMAVAIAVLIFVLLGLENAKYEDIDEGNYHLEANDLVKLQKESNHFRPTYNMAIGIGVVLCIFGGTAPILTEEVLKLSENSFALILFPSIALGVYLFIYYGVLGSAYDKLINPEKIQKEIEESEKDYGWLYGITMPLAAMVFLLIGFYRGGWHPAWIIFPIVAICTSAVQMILINTRKQ